MGTLGHKGQGALGDVHHSLAVQIDHVQIVLQGDLIIPGKPSKAAGIDQKGHIGLSAVQFSLKALIAFGLQKIQRQDMQGHFDLFLQFFQLVLPTGNDPDLIQIAPGGGHFDKFPTHAGRCAGDDGSIHKGVLPCHFSTVYHRFHKKKTEILSKILRTIVCIHRTSVL